MVCGWMVKKSWLVTNAAVMEDKAMRICFKQGDQTLETRPSSSAVFGPRYTSVSRFPSTSQTTDRERTHQVNATSVVLKEASTARER
ncbi:hypothetical protein GN244_ATG03769 [Phytophthora infestans]|uniref:Uncharacterized protein n=1 Tax=Phytophthora infestans TaxID=4787 RepID=A0A833WZW8_PHYIN|nr:hypothetical protein GN244_ATG03769 [Phytophthora infestans]